MTTGTELAPIDESILTIIRRLAPKSTNMAADAVRVAKLVELQELMRFEMLTYQEALERVGLSRQTVHNWNRRWPYLSEAAAYIGVRQMDDEITTMLLGARPRIIENLINDALNNKSPKVRHAAFQLLQQHGYRPIDSLVQALETEQQEKETAKGEQGPRARSRIKPSFQPVFQVVATMQLPDGRRFFANNDTVDGEYVVTSDEEE